MSFFDEITYIYERGDEGKRMMGLGDEGLEEALEKRTNFFFHSLLYTINGDQIMR